RLTGAKPAVPLARQAAAILVPASTPTGEVVIAVLDGDTPGVTLVDEQTSSGEPAATVELDGASVTEVLAGGREALRFASERYLVALCATELGIAAEALRMAAAHTSTREQFGRPLATFQAVAVRLGNGFIDVQAMQSTLWQALYRLDAGLGADEQVATAAFWAAEAGERVLTSAVHLHGGLGVDTDYPLHRWFLASKVIELALGGASFQLDQLGSLLAGVTT
nr:acyl-CoA dehydrogenase [Actinomycetota bacterium]